MFNFDDEYLHLVNQYSLDPDRTSLFLHFLQTDHTDGDFAVFIHGLSGKEYFFVLDLQLLLHRRCIDRLHNLFF